MTVNPFYRYGGDRISLVTPFTYRDGVSLLRLIEDLRRYVATDLNDSLNSTLQDFLKKYQDFEEMSEEKYGEFVSDINTLVESINNRVGPVPTQFITTSGGLVVNAEWPSLQPVNFHLTNDGGVFELPDNVKGVVYIDTQLNSTATFQLQPNGDGTWTVKQDFNTVQGAVDVRSFGAVGDGVSDDTHAFIAALNSISSGGIIEVNGNYKIGRISIKTPDIVIRGSGKIIGGGFDIGENGNSSPYTTMNTVISGLRFVGEGKTSSAITAARVRDIDISGCTFTNYLSAFYVRPQSFTTTETLHVSRVKFTNNRTWDCDYVVFVPRYLSGGGTLVAADFTVTDNPTIFANITHIHADGLDGLIASNNVMFHLGNHLASLVKKHNIYINGGSYINISDNLLFEAGEESVLLNKCQNFGITGNRIGFPGQLKRTSGIAITGGDSSGTEFCVGSVSNNTIMFPTLHGISVRGVSGHISIDSNVVRSPGASTRYYGTEPEPTSADYIVTEASTKHVSVSGGLYSGGSKSPKIKVMGSHSKVDGDHNFTALAITEPVNSDQFGTITVVDGLLCRLSSSGINNYLTYQTKLTSGTFKFSLAHISGIDRGNYTIRISGETVEEIGVIDGYEESSQTKVDVLEFVNNVPRVVTIEVIMRSKNSSSTGYRGVINTISISRVGN